MCGDPRKDEGALLCFIHTLPFIVSLGGMGGSKIAGFKLICFLSTYD